MNDRRSPRDKAVAALAEGSTKLGLLDAAVLADTWAATRCGGLHQYEAQSQFKLFAAMLRKKAQEAP